jgi:hypothetical protein
MNKLIYTNINLYNIKKYFLSKTNLEILLFYVNI